MQDDFTSIERVLASFYQGISGTEDQACDQAALRQLFCDGAAIVAYPQDAAADGLPKAVSAHEYIDWLARALEGRRFFERGYDYRMDVNGDIAQVWSRYDASEDPSFNPVQKSGTNLILLVRVNGDWKLASMVYQNDE